MYHLKSKLKEYQPLTQPYKKENLGWDSFCK